MEETLQARVGPQNFGLNRYFNARLLDADLRFASDPQYIFYSQFVSELNITYNSVSKAVQKISNAIFDEQHITAAQLRDPEKRKHILSSDTGYQFLSKARESPAYWEWDIFAKLRQLGIPTWFCSFSAENKRWPEILTAICTPEDIDWSTYCNLINGNPVTACRMFQNRVLNFITELILSPAQPIGKISDFFYRTEFQSRGWPNIHCLFWCSNVPVFHSRSINQDFVHYVDKYITCSISEQDTDPELFEIVTNVQMNLKRHSKACKKGNRLQIWISSTTILKDIHR